MKVNKIALNNLRKFIINTLIVTGMFTWLRIFWWGLEVKFDNGIQVSNSDTIISLILVLLLWNIVIKWFVVKESEVEQ